MDLLWISCGSAVDQLWISSGSAVDQLWIYCGSTVDQLWISCGSTVYQLKLPSASCIYLHLLSVCFQDIEAYVKMESAERRQAMGEIREKIKSEEEKRIGAVFFNLSLKILIYANMFVNEFSEIDSPSFNVSSICLVGATCTFLKINLYCLTPGYICTV